ncbi:hypothetical protein MESS2_1100036 [Mesorhizobium metallidurans STM 2683]|uniref:Uncharacterized protein n=1 Tax=Mesorhizobium metallidurans STM 2683 TaxID=1297569 RepID=M5EVL4_9HYPH|nr:hypothetical protein MESS2_1100036 [Mesorhizobium metallidurans STM 2683]
MPTRLFDPDFQQHDPIHGPIPSGHNPDSLSIGFFNDFLGTELHLDGHALKLSMRLDICRP